MKYSEKEALKQLPEASNWSKFSGVGEYDHMDLIDYIDGLCIDVPSIPDYCIAARLNTAFQGHASVWYTEMKEISGRGNWQWWKSQIIQKYSNEKELFPTKEKNFKSASGKITSIGTIIKEIITCHRKGNIRINPEFLVLEDAHIQGFLPGTEYQRMYGIYIKNSKNRHITTGKRKEKKFSLHIYHMSNQDPLEELLNGFQEGQFNANLTSKKKLSSLKILRQNIPAFAIGNETLGMIRCHDIELYLDAKRPCPSISRKPGNWERN
ncbi:hypothetical protein O181_005061 [Austropuccinia psidii MF-1]|uniref:Retrotransposon gag domain-containing protein n=1 Tax=Austropuccinia psidii MF-1 TaxID=1389203 RepID=A0A9Q3BGM8_9BASI|nr:hypothetical protein [Austropuccinia psidii MF-1]